MGSTTTQKESWDAYGTMVLTSGLAVVPLRHTVGDRFGGPTTYSVDGFAMTGLRAEYTQAVPWRLGDGSPPPPIPSDFAAWLGDTYSSGEGVPPFIFSTYGVTQAFLPLLTRSRGVIVNNVSMMAFAPVPLTPAYSISKAAAFSMTQSLRALLARRGVRAEASQEEQGHAEATKQDPL